MRLVFLFCFLPIQLFATVVDTHLHVSTKTFNQHDATIQSAQQAMNEAGVDRAVILSAGYAKDKRAEARIENDYVAKIAAEDAKFIGFCGVSMVQPWAEEEIERCITKLKLTGLKIHPMNDGLDLRSKKDLKTFEKVIAKANSFGLPVVVDSAWLDSRVTINVMMIAMRYPKVKLIFAHALFTEYRDLFTMASLYEFYPTLQRNIYLDLSATAVAMKDNPEKDLWVWNLRKFGLDRAFFGSDFPIATPAKTIEALQTFGFTADELTGILGNNFLREIMVPEGLRRLN